MASATGRPTLSDQLLGLEHDDLGGTFGMTTLQIQRKGFIGVALLAGDTRRSQGDTGAFIATQDLTGSMPQERQEQSVKLIDMLGSSASVGEQMALVVLLQRTAT